MSDNTMTRLIISGEEWHGMEICS